MNRTLTRDIVFLFIISRLMLMLVTYFGYILLTAPKYSSTPVDISTFFTLWNHWDAAHYISIAHYGYQNRNELAFFPLFPLLIAVFSYPLGSWSYLLVGTLISNGALLAASFVIYSLAIQTVNEALASHSIQGISKELLATNKLDNWVGQRTLLYICIFPTALFFFAAYNESLFLLLTAGSFLAMRRQTWWLAGTLGFFAALTRSAGAFLIVPYLYELWLARESVTASRKNLAFGILPMLLIPLGTLLYCFYCWHVSGDPLAFATVQINWARHLSWPWQGIWQNLFELFWNQPFGSFFEVHVLLDLLATLGFIALIIIGRRMLRTSYTLWSALILFLVCLTPTLGQHDALISNQRIVLELFPCFITLAVLGVKYPRLHQALLILFPPLLATLSLIFVMNLWMV